MVKLTRQENNIFQLILKSYSSKEIADILNISVSTVDTHKTHIRRKLKIKVIAAADIKNAPGRKLNILSNNNF